jgi:outer membrane protein assembly factor BamA
LRSLLLACLVAIPSAALAEIGGTQGPLGIAGEPVRTTVPPQRILGIRVEGLGATEEGELLQLVALREGELVSRRRVRRSVQRLYETGRFANVEAWLQPRASGGVDLFFRVEPKRWLRVVEVLAA